LEQEALRLAETELGAGPLEVVDRLHPEVEVLPGAPGNLEGANITDVTLIVKTPSGAESAINISRVGDADAYVTMMDDGARGTTWEVRRHDSSWLAADEAGRGVEMSPAHVASTASATCYYSISTPQRVQNSVYGPLLRSFAQFQCSPAPNNISLVATIQERGSVVGGPAVYSDTNQTLVFGNVYAECKDDPDNFWGTFYGVGWGDADGVIYPGSSGPASGFDHGCGTFFT
jgi:hypothetical protein